MKDAQVFTPRALSQAPIVSEGRLVRDLTSKPLDLDFYDIPSFERNGKKAFYFIGKRKPAQHALLMRQAS